MENIKKSFIQLEDKSLLKICGVNSVVSITETEVNVVINDEIFNIKGNQIKAEKLLVEQGELILSGMFYSLKFEEHKQKKSFFKRIFK